MPCSVVGSDCKLKIQSIHVQSKSKICVGIYSFYHNTFGGIFVMSVCYHVRDTNKKWAVSSFCLYAKFKAFWKHLKLMLNCTNLVVEFMFNWCWCIFSDACKLRYVYCWMGGLIITNYSPQYPRTCKTLTSIRIWSSTDFNIARLLE